MPRDPRFLQLNDYPARFGGVARLFGDDGLARLRRAHAAVIGLGGVGSWACEALARSGVGALTLVDMDEVGVTNVNRQLPALTKNLGRPKAEVLAERARGIQPEMTVHPMARCFTAATAEALLGTRYDCLVDAIDSPSLKALLIASCRVRGIPVVTVGGAGGRRDPTRVCVADLAHTSHDPLLAGVRRLLRREHGFPRGDAPFGVECVFSSEPLSYPPDPAPASAGQRRFGTACFVTGTCGFVAAARVVARIVILGVSP